MKKRLLLLSLSMLVLSGLAAATQAGPIYPPKRLSQSADLQPAFLRLGVGIAPVYLPVQPGLDPVGMPFDLFLEYGFKASRFSAALAFNTGGTYDQVLVALAPSHLSAQLHYRLLEGRNFRTYAFAGLNYWEASLSMKPYPGVVNYQHRQEHDSGWGLVGGLGAGFSPMRNLEIGSRITAFSGKGAFLAGAFDKQPTQIGSWQLSAYIAFKLPFGRSGISCPTY